MTCYAADFFFCDGAKQFWSIKSPPLIIQLNKHFSALTIFLTREPSSKIDVMNEWMKRFEWQKNTVDVVVSEAITFPCHTRKRLQKKFIYDNHSSFKWYVSHGAKEHHNIHMIPLHARCGKSCSAKPFFHAHADEKKKYILWENAMKKKLCNWKKMNGKSHHTNCLTCEWGTSRAQYERRKNIFNINAHIHL